VSELGGRLVERLGRRAGEIADDAALAAALAEAFDAAKARLPHEPVARGVLVDRIAGALLASDDPPELAALRRLHHADLYLACALAAVPIDDQALALVEAELMPAVRQSAGRVDANAAFVDEVCQRVRDRLLVGTAEQPAAIAQYRGGGPLARWVRVIASRIALDIKRGDAKIDREGEDALASLPAPGDPQLEVIWRTCAAEYKVALAAAFETLSRRERNLLRQRYIDDLNIDALGRLYRVHPATTFRWLKQVEQRLAASTRAALMDKLALSESQAESMERMVVSQLQISLTRMLRGGKKTS
jgi:RNA polymerase sigma-70 factor (ECF subfamily)